MADSSFLRRFSRLLGSRKSVAEFGKGCFVRLFNRAPCAPRFVKVSMKLQSQEKVSVLLAAIMIGISLTLGVKRLVA